jgi:sarcosine oxidase subunit beta
MKRSAEVVVVGGGCMGASVAYHLARRGVTDVVLVEREQMLGTGSTGRNAGGVRHQFSNDANIRLSIESIGLLEHFAGEVGHPIDFHQDGYLFLLSTPASVETFQRNVVLQRSLGVDVQWLDARDAARLAPGLSVDGVAAATFCQRDGIADPNGVTMGFAKTAQALGVSVERDAEVTGIRVDAGRVAAVETTRGTIETRIVVNAAGPHARSIGRMAGVDVPVDPIRRHIFIAAFDPSASSGLRPAGDSLRMPSSHIMVIDFETTFYFHREGAGLLFGMGDPHETPTFDTTVQWDFLPQVIDVAVTRLPALADASISHAWAGLYEMTPDANPIIGAANGVEGFYLINGFSGHGFQHSPAAGRILADVITGRDPEFDLTPFAAGRFARPGAAAGERYVV